MFTPIPTKLIGPIHIRSTTWEAEVCLPFASFETTLFPSTQRGAKLSRLCGGIQVTTLKNTMTRSIILQAPSLLQAYEILEAIKQNPDFLYQAAASSSRFLKLESYFSEIIGNQLFLRFSFFTGDAAGHNMTTKAADSLIQALLARFSDLSYVSVSGNLCVDKKVSTINALLGRGKHVLAELILPRTLVAKHLRSSPEKIKDLNIRKNLMGSILAGSVRSANAHFANMLLASYLATGQDAANIVEGSQGITYADINPEGDLSFSISLPNLIVGTLGNGKNNPEIQARLHAMGCTPDPLHPGASALRLAEIIAASVLCGELSLLAAQTNSGELMKSHLLFERP